MRFMKACLNKWSGCVVAAVAAALPLFAAQAADVRQARVWAGPEYTRVVLDASGPLKYSVNQADGRVVIDLPGSDVASGFSAPSSQGLFRSLSHSRTGDRLQLTASVAPGSLLKSFVLGPDGGSNYRLVLDLYPGKATAGAAAVAATPVNLAPPVAASAAPVAMPEYVGPAHGSRKAIEQAAAMLKGQRADRKSVV